MPAKQFLTYPVLCAIPRSPEMYISYNFQMKYQLCSLDGKDNIGPPVKARKP